MVMTKPQPLGYVVNVLEDAHAYSTHAGKKELDQSDIKLAIENRMDHSFTSPPPRDVCCHVVTMYVIFVTVSYRNGTSKKLHSTSTDTGEIWATLTSGKILLDR